MVQKSHLNRGYDAVCRALVEAQMETKMTDAEKQDGVYSLTKPAIMAFPNLLSPKAFKDPKTGKEKGEPKYGCNLILEPDSDDLKGLKALAVKIARANAPQAELKSLFFPFQSGDKLADAAKAKKRDGEYQRGKVVLSARSKYQPRMSVFANGKILDLEGDSLVKYQGQFYPGVLVYAQINLVWFPVGQTGVNAYLNMVLSTNKGERLQSGKSAAEVFSGYVGNLSAEDPTAGQTVGDEIPF